MFRSSASTPGWLTASTTRRPTSRKNPNALVPLLEDGDFTLWESNAIVRYLCARYGAPTLATSCASLPPEGAAPCLGRPGAAATTSTLYPEDLRTRFDAERWMDWQQTTLNRAGGPAFIQWIRTPAEQRQPAVIATVGRGHRAACWQMLDAHLARLGPGWRGEHFTMADIPIGCEIHRWWGLPQPRQALPNLARWYAAVQARPAARGVLDLPLS
jgi:glutathione S-transferase